MSADATIRKKYDAQPLFRKRWFWGALIGLTLVAGLAWISFSQTLVAGREVAGGPAAGLEPAPIAGYPAPDFELPTLDGQIYRLSDFKGTPVIVNFWATWCGPCRAEFPEFQEAAVDNADRLVIIGVNNTATDQVDEIGPFIEEFGITFPIVLDETGETAEAYRILGLPTTVFVDRDGLVNEVFTGPLNKAYIESKISELEAGL